MLVKWEGEREGKAAITRTRTRTRMRAVVVGCRVEKGFPLLCCTVKKAVEKSTTKDQMAGMGRGKG